MWGCHFLLLYSSIIFTVCEGKVRFPLLLFGSSVFWVSHARFWSNFFIVLKPNIICTFLIHYGSVQKMLTAFFNFVWNTKKNKWIIFFECPGKIFLSIEKPYCTTLPSCFSPHFWEKNVTFLLSYNLRNIVKQNWH